MLAVVTKRIGRGKYFRKKKFSTKNILNNNYSINSFFSFIQIGANDGVSFDFLYDFVTKRDAIGIVVEPVQSYFAELLENYKKYPKIIKVNKAVHKQKKDILIYKIKEDKIHRYPEWVKGIASFEIVNITKFGMISEHDIIHESVKADTLENIISQCKIFDFDYFQVFAWLQDHVKMLPIHQVLYSYFL
jgi:hypothetical protein